MTSEITSQSGNMVSARTATAVGLLGRLQRSHVACCHLFCSFWRELRKDRRSGGARPVAALFPRRNNRMSRLRILACVSLTPPCVRNWPKLWNPGNG